jgi:hypothetical protein
VPFRHHAERGQVQRVVKPQHPPRRQLAVYRSFKVYQRMISELREPGQRQPNPSSEGVQGT